MLIVWGASTKNLGYNSLNRTCKACNCKSLALVTYEEIFDLFWIPTFPIRKHYVVACARCSASYSIDSFEDKERIIKEFGCQSPWTSCIGALLVLLFFLFAIFSTSHSDSGEEFASQITEHFNRFLI